VWFLAAVGGLAARWQGDARRSVVRAAVDRCSGVRQNKRLQIEAGQCIYFSTSHKLTRINNNNNNHNNNDNMVNFHLNLGLNIHSDNSYQQSNAGNTK